MHYLPELRDPRLPGCIVLHLRQHENDASRLRAARPELKLAPVESEAGDETHGLERDHARQRHRLARFRRRSIVVSKAKRTVDALIAPFARFGGNGRIGELTSMLASDSPAARSSNAAGQQVERPQHLTSRPAQPDG
jgi:hypothetical protein